MLYSHICRRPKKAAILGAMLTVIFIITVVFGLLISTAKYAYASDAEVQNVGNFEGLIADAKASGVKTGNDLIHNSTPRQGYGDYFQPIDVSHFISPDVLILIDQSESINTETDLENYIDGTTRTTPLYTLFDSESVPSRIVALWSVPESDWENVTTTNDVFIGAPNFLKDILTKNGFQMNYNDHKGDPDGSCDSVVVCFRHDDGGNTGFHSVPVCYYGRWDHVHTAINPTQNHKATLYEANGDIDTLAPVNIHNYSPSKSFNTVDTV